MASDSIKPCGHHPDSGCTCRPADPPEVLPAVDPSTWRHVRPCVCAWASDGEVAKITRYLCGAVIVEMEKGPCVCDGDQQCAFHSSITTGGGMVYEDFERTASISDAINAGLVGEWQFTAGEQDLLGLKPGDTLGNAVVGAPVDDDLTPIAPDDPILGPPSRVYEVEALASFAAQAADREARARAVLTERVQAELQSRLDGEFMDPADGESMRRAAKVSVDVFVEWLRNPPERSG